MVVMDNLGAVRSRASGRPLPVVQAACTCDSLDVLCEADDYRLPAQLKPGDCVQI